VIKVDKVWVAEPRLKVIQKVEEKHQGQDLEGRRRGRFRGTLSEETEVKLNNREKRVFVL
jgi:hypothetical protein